jgi:hypothetical protein
MSYPCRESNPGHPARCLPLYRQCTLYSLRSVKPMNYLSVCFCFILRCNSGYMASNGWMISEQGIGKERLSRGRS